MKYKTELYRTKSKWDPVTFPFQQVCFHNFRSIASRTLWYAKFCELVWRERAGMKEDNPNYKKCNCNCEYIYKFITYSINNIKFFDTIKIS